MSLGCRLLLYAGSILGFAAALHAQSSGSLKGQVVDTSGAAIPGAAVLVRHSPAAEERLALTEADGAFTFEDCAGGEHVVRVAAAGFAEILRRVTVMPDELTSITIVLSPAALAETVVVTASRGAERLTTPSSASVLTSADIMNTAAATVDDALRNTPGFSLFRRSSSRVSTPPTQGVTLRGIAGSGASRTLVLGDGLPLNDPFGSWVAWNRIPVAALERVEVVRGAAGDLYGADAMGGVIQLLTFDPGRPRLRTVVEAGSFETVRASVFGSSRIHRWALGGAGEWQDTAGVVRVTPADRGPVDTPMTDDYATGFATVAYEGDAWRAQGRASHYDEDRGRGTPLLVDDTTWRQLAGEVGFSRGRAAFLARGGGGRQEYVNNFSSISADRTVERLTREQTIPTTFATGSAQLSAAWSRVAVLVGGEGRHTTGRIDEIRYSPAGIPSGPFQAGGTETGAALFGRTKFDLNDRVTITASARGDFWQSVPRDAQLPTHQALFLSPHASVAFQLSPPVTLRVAGYRSYRTPTLNELHRAFRVGDTLTDGNPLLDPERMTGVEGGILVGRKRLSARITGFYSLVNDLVANITVSVTPSLIARQKQNADTARAAGLELEADLRTSTHVTLSGFAAFTASHFVETPKQPALDGKRVPQVPGYHAGGTVTYSAPDILTASAQLRVVGMQFDDDRNELPLGAYAIVDAYASRAIWRGVQAFAAIENIFDTEYDVARTPLRTIGWPRTIRAGVKVFMPR